MGRKARASGRSSQLDLPFRSHGPEAGYHVAARAASCSLAKPTRLTKHNRMRIVMIITVIRSSQDSSWILMTAKLAHASLPFLALAPTSPT